MELTVISPKGVVCREEAYFVQLPGAAGRFTVLHNHAPLVSVLVEGEIRYQVNVDWHSIPIKGGFVRVGHNKIEVTAELAENN
ncbi:MAG: F0F1 ATP synthase subunit epsilon [Bacteroidales bacterium]|nr:F0F1 ATP synthase subunit epsilon [Bacteroidales bacterium]